MLRCHLEAVEDEVEPELELGAEVVAGLQDVLGCQFHEVWVLACGERVDDALSEVGHLLSAGGRQVRFLERESVEVAVDEGVGVGGHLDREAASA